MTARRTGTMATLTFQDWLQLPHESGLHEIIDGEHVVTPSPHLYHQTVSRRIQFQLYVQIEERGRGQVFNAPAGVKLSDINVFEPDLFVVLAEREHILKGTHVDGPPDLAIEILSHSTHRRDRGPKKERYARYGVREYWIVDPWEKVVEQLVLEGAEYARAGEHRQGQVALRVLPDVRVDLRKVW